MARSASALRLSAVMLCLWGSWLSSPKLAAEEEINPAQKYHAALRKRPEPGYLFDRFYNTWLDQSTVESLQDFLQKEVEQADTTANRLLLAYFYSKQNNDTGAIEEFDKALKNDPASAEAWYYKAQAESRTLDFETAIADLRRAREQKPSAKLALSIERLLGTMLLRNHQAKEAIGVWKALLAANPGDEELCEDIIELYIEESLFSEAAAQLESLAVRTKDPYTAVMRRLRLGDVHYRSGNRAKAIEVYVATLRESGQDTWLERDILAQIEQIYRAEDDLSGLKKQYASLIETYPKRIGLQRRRCRLLVDLGEHDEAIKGYRAILELTPGDRNNREEYVEMLCRIGRHELAVKELESLCQQNSKDAELQVRLAKTLQQAKQSDKAVEAVRQYLKIADQSEYAYLRAARLVESFGNKEIAKEFHQRLVEKFPDSPSAQEAHAVFLYANGQKEEALAIWKKMAEKADVTQTLNIARALEGRGEDALVLELLKNRETDFGKEPLFLGQLVNTALRLRQFEQAIPWAKRRVELSKTTMELEGAVTQVVTACQQSEKVDTMISELKANGQRSIQLTCLLAELLETFGESKAADELLRIPAEKGEQLAVGEQIRIFTLRGEWAAAAEATSRLFDLSGGRQSQYARRLVELYERDGRFTDALKWIETWKRLSPGATTPWLTEVRLLKMQGGKETELLNALRKAIQRFEEDDELRVQLAQSYQESRKIRDAQRVFWQLYEKSNEVDAKLRWASELARLAREEGTTAQLVEDFRQRVKTNKQSIVPVLAMAEIYRIADDFDNRRQALMAATKIKPDDLQLLTQIARLEESEGDWKAALSTLEQALKLDKTDQTRQKIARLHLEYGNRDTGFAMLRELLGEQLGDPRVLERMADSLCGMQEWDRVVELLRNRTAEHRGDYRLHYLLGVAYEELGQMPEAAEQFIAMLDIREELPGIKKNTSLPLSGRSSYTDILREMMPAETVEWMGLQEHRYSAYAYRESRQMGVSYSSRSAAPAASINVPPSVDAARPYALVHLFSLAQGFDQSQQATLIAKLAAHGVRNPKPWMKLGIDRNTGAMPIAEALEEDPDNEALLAINVIYGIQQSRPDRSDDLARAFKKFREKRPALALMAAIQAASVEQKHAALVDEAAALAARIDRPNPIAMMSLAQALGGMPGRPDMGDSVLDKDQRRKIVKVLIDWYPRMSQDNSLYGPWAFTYVVSAVRSGDTPQAYFEMLDGEVARWRKNPGKQNAQNQSAVYYSRSSNVQLIDPFGFPPQELTDFPQNVLGLLARSPNSPYTQIMGSGEKPDWDTEKIKTQLQKIKDPTLRLLLANELELPETVEATLKELLAMKPPRLDAYLLAAGKANADSRFGEAVEFLEKARLLPMKQEMRQRVDAALVSAAISAKDNAAGRDELFKAARDAALRLRRQRLDPQQREQLVTAFEELGMKEEAKKLEKQTGIAALSSLLPRMYSSPAAAARAPNTPNDRIAKLVSAGNRDAAARLLVAEVKSLGQQQTANFQNMRYYRQMMRDLKQRISRNGLNDDVLKQMSPGESNNATRLYEYGLACEMFDREEEAIKSYEKILSQRSKDDLARIRLISILLPKNDNAEALEKHLSQLSAAGGSMLGQLLSGYSNDYDASWDEQFRYVELAIRFLEKQKKDPRADLDWANQLIYSFGRQQYSNRAQSYLPSLYQRQGARESGRSVDAKLLERRAKLHRDLCLQLIDTPELGRTGFSHLLAAAEARSEALAANDSEKKSERKNDAPDTASSSKEIADAFLQYAEKVLLGEVNQKAKRGMRNVTRYYSSNTGEVRFRSPEEYLAAQAWKSGDWRRIDDTLLPQINQSSNRQAGKSLERLAKLYRCPEEAFLETARQVVKDSASSMPPKDDGLSIVVDVWADRELTLDLQPMILDHVRRNSANANTMTSPFPVRYPEALVAQGKFKQAEAVMEELAVIYLGPKEKRADFVNKNYQRQSITWGSTNAKIHIYVTLLRQLAQKDSLAFLVLLQVKSLPDSLQAGDISSLLNEYIQRVREQKPEKVVAMLESSPWVADLDQFSVLAVGRSVEQWPLVQLLRDSSFISDEKMKPFWTAFEERQKASPTFGRGLLLAVHAGKTEHKALAKYVTKHLENVQKLPAKQQSELSLLLKSLMTHGEQTDGDVALAPVQQWLNQRLADRSSQLLEKYRNAKRLEELGFSSNDTWEIGRNLGQILPDVIREDPPAAVKLFLRTIALAEDAQKRSQSQSYYGSERTLGSMILEQMLQQSYNGEGDPHLLVFLIDLLETPEAAQMPLGQSSGYIVDNVLRQWQNRLAQHGAPNQKQTEQFYEELGKMLGKRSSALLIPNLFNMLRNGNSEKDQWTIDWATQAIQKGEYPALAADLLACGRLCQEKTRPNENQSKSEAKQPERDEMADYHAHFQKMITKDDSPLAVRLTVALFVTQQLSIRKIPSALAHDSIQLYLAALEKETAVSALQHRYFLGTLLALRGDAAFKESLDRWRERFAQQYLRTVSRTPSPTYSRGWTPDSLDDSEALCDALYLYLAAGDAERADSLLSKYDSQLARSPMVLASLMQFAKIDLAAKFYRDHWSTLKHEWNIPNIPLYDSELLKNLPAFAEKLQNEEERVFAELLLATMLDETRSPSLTDAASKMPLGLPTRDERMAALASRLKNTTFANAELKTRSILALITSEKASARLADEIAAEYKKIDVKQIGESDQYENMEAAVPLLHCHVKNRLLADDIQPFLETLEKLSKIESRNPHYIYQRMASPLISACCEAMEKSNGRWTPDCCEKVASALRDLIKNEYMFYSDRERTISLLVGTHLLSNQSEAFIKWFPDLPQNARSQFQVAYQSRNVFEFLKKTRAHVDPPADDDDGVRRRIGYVGDYARIALVLGGIDTVIFDNAISSGLVTKKEFIEHGSEAIRNIEDKVKDSESPKVALAKWMTNAKEPGRAAALWSAAIAATPDNNQQQKNSWRFELARSLRMLGKIDAAKATVAEIDTNALPPEVRKNFEKFRSEVNELKNP